jgi:DNA mismatch endonuclease (patch repair protein)
MARKPANHARKRAPSFKGLKPKRASKAARGASRKKGTRAELLLRKAFRAAGLKFKTNVASLPGCPDFVFPEARLVVFCDGDFWHGRNLKERVRRLAKGHNAGYWVAKIARNVARDRASARELRRAGWRVRRVWESNIAAAPERAAAGVVLDLESIRE